MARSARQNTTVLNYENYNCGGRQCKYLLCYLMIVMEARAGIEPAIELLQSPALPLGYLAITLKIRPENA